MSVWFKNVSSIGSIDIPRLGDLTVPEGGLFEVPDALVEYFEPQAVNFQRVPDDIESMTSDELTVALEAVELDTTGKVAEKRERLLEYFPIPEPADEPEPEPEEPYVPEEISSPYLNLPKPDEDTDEVEVDVPTAQSDGESGGPDDSGPDDGGQPDPTGDQDGAGDDPNGGTDQ